MIFLCIIFISQSCNVINEPLMIQLIYITPIYSGNQCRIYTIRLYEYRKPQSELPGWGSLYSKALRMTPGMRVFFANGRFDCCTYTGYIDYLLNHGGLPKERVCRKNYNSGHMIYYGEENVTEFCDDVRRFILGGMPANQ